MIQIHYKEKMKKIVADMVINLLGTGISLVILQLIIYPLVARMISAEEYGEMQSLISVVYLIGGTLGGALSTTRLIREFDYQENKIKADFNLLSTGCILAIVVVMPVILNVYTNNTFDSILLTTMVTILNYSVNYLNVGLRLNLDYKAIFIDKVLTCFGYGIGFLVFSKTLTWQYIFILSALIEILYYIFKTDLLKEPYKKSKLFPFTIKTFGNLSIANLLTKALTYFDKLMLYPLLGGRAVSIYFAANIFGKLILQAIEPITNVILSYLSRTKKLSNSFLKVIIPATACICLIMYIFCLLISKPILMIFYPQWANEAYELIPLATLSLAISSFIQILYPFTLKMLDTNKQIIINSAGLIVYIFMVLILYSKLDLMGCCLALLISYILKMILIFCFCLRKK